MHHGLIGIVALAMLPWNTASAQTRTAPVAPQRPSPLLLDAPGAPPAASQRPEDWAALPLDKSNLPLSRDRGIVIGRIEAPEYTRELIRLQWRPADPIDLYLVLPKGVKGPPVILYLYDFTSDPARFRDDGWCKRMTKNGFAAAGFNSALSGDRLHSPRPMKEWFVSELQEALASSVHDVQMVLNYLGTRGDLDLNDVGIFGQGSGGSIAILAAAADPRIKAIDVMDPWGDWPDWLKDSQQVPDAERPLYLRPSFLGKVSSLDPVNYLPGLGPRALRVEQTLDDTVTPHAARDRIMTAVIGPEHVIRYKDWAALQQAYSSTGLSSWLQSQLRPAKVAPASPGAGTRSK